MFGSKVTEVFALSNLHPSETGIAGAVIFISSGEFEGKRSPHGPRLKVMLGSKVTTKALKEAVTVTLADPPQVFGELPASLKKKVIAFVQTNREALLKYWRFENSTQETLNSLRKIR